MTYWLNVYGFYMNRQLHTFIGANPKFPSRIHADLYTPSIGLIVLYRIKVTEKTIQ